MTGSTPNIRDYESLMKMKKDELLVFANEEYGFTMRRNLTKKKTIEIIKFLDNGEINHGK